MMPLILKAAGQRVYPRGSDGKAKLHVYGVQNWTHIKDRAEAANLFTFEFAEPCRLDGGRYIPAVRDEILIYRSEWDFQNDVRWFGGLLASVEELTSQHGGLSYSVNYQLEAQSFDILLDKELRQPQKAGLSWESLLRFLLSTHFSAQLSADYSFIRNPVEAPPIRINNGNLRTLLRAMRQLSNRDYYVDAYKRLHVFQSVEQPGSFQVDDQPASGLTVWESRPTVTREGRAIYNIVRQPFQSHVTLGEWDGETFTAKGDPKGQGGRLPLLRTPSTIAESIYLEDKFDGNAFNADLWVETDTNATRHVDYPNQGYLFCAEGQCQLVGGSGTIGSVALVSQEFYGFVEGCYLVQEFQLTSSSGEGYIALFTDGGSLFTSSFRAGLWVQDGQLKALDGTVLVNNLGTTDNYLLWVTMLGDGWQYDIQGGRYATKQTIHRDYLIGSQTHLSDYKIAPVVTVSMQASINSVRLKQSDRGVLLEVNGERKVVGLESSDTDLPDIDAFLNVDETPALIKFRAAEAIAVVASVASPTQFSVATGQGADLKTGQRLLIGDDIIDEFNGRAAIVRAVAGDVVTLVSPGLGGFLSVGQQILVNTTIPAKGDKIVVRYGYVKGDEAVAYDQASMQRYGPLPVTLAEKDHIRRFDDAQMEAENYLERYRDGLLTLRFESNSRLIPNEPSAMTAIPVNLTKRPEPVTRTLILQRIEMTPLGGMDYHYSLQLESSDPVKPFEELFKGRSLNIGSDGEIRFTLNLTEQAIAQAELTIQRIDSGYMTWANPTRRRWGEFKWKPDNSRPDALGGRPTGLLLAITQAGTSIPGSDQHPVLGQPIGLLLSLTYDGANLLSTSKKGQPIGLLLALNQE